MNLVQILTFLHITFVMLALGMVVFPGILLAQIAASGDVTAIRNAYRIGMYHGRVGGMLLGIGVLFGFATASYAGFQLLSGWLVATYVAIVIIVGLGIGFHARHEAHIYAVASSGRDDAGAECTGLS